MILLPNIFLELQLQCKVYSWCLHGPAPPPSFLPPFTFSGREVLIPWFPISFISKIQNSRFHKTCLLSFNVMILHLKTISNILYQSKRKNSVYQLLFGHIQILETRCLYMAIKTWQYHYYTTIQSCKIEKMKEHMYSSKVYNYMYLIT